MNVELAREAIQAAKDDPDNFDMTTWVEGFPADYVKTELAPKPPCGSTACYAGFVSLLDAPVGSGLVGNAMVGPSGNFLGFVWDYAAKALGITNRQADGIFYLDDIEEVERAVEYLADNPDAEKQTIRLAAKGIL